MTIAEYTSNVAQIVPVNGDVTFENVAVKPCGCNIMHRNGSGAVMLRGGAKYLVSFGANISGATAGTEVSLALAIDGDVIESTTIASTPAVADDLNNVSARTIIAVPCGCCNSITVENVGTTDVTVEDANIIIERLEA